MNSLDFIPEGAINNKPAMLNRFTDKYVQH